MADPTGSLINLDGLARPAVVLIEKISDAIGVVFQPTQIRRIAKAEADGAIIRASGEIEVSDLQRRAFRRVAEEETRHQQNIEDITRMALPDLSEHATPERVEADWLAHFFDRARLISDKDMQSLWSKLLAGEANRPGSFGRRTVNLVSSLERDDATLFTKLCAFCWTFDQAVPLIFDKQEEVYSGGGISFIALTHLDAIGLINFDAIAGFTLGGLPRRIALGYHGRRFLLELPKDADNQIDIGHVMLTASGRQLAPIAGSTPREGFVEYVSDHLRTKGFKLTEAARLP